MSTYKYDICVESKLADKDWYQIARFIILLLYKICCSYSKIAYYSSCIHLNDRNLYIAF